MNLSECQIPYSIFQIRAKGFASLFLLIFIIGIASVVIAGFSFVALREAKITRDFANSLKAYYAGESGIEDGVYRFVSGKQIVSGEAVSTGTGTTTITIATAGSTKTITSLGRSGSSYRSVEASISESTTGVGFYYGVQVGDGGLSLSNGSMVVGNIYSNGNVTGSGSITGDVIVAGGIASEPSVVWTSENSAQPFATAAANRDIAQSFIPGVSGNLNKVSVYLAKNGNPNANLTLRVAADNSGKPSTSSLASASISFASVGVNPSWIDVSFVSPPNLSSGSKYWIILDYGSNSAVNYWIWRKDSTDGYAGNTGKTTANWSSGTATWADVGGDLAFKAWVGGTNTMISGVTVGNGTSGSGRANVFENANIHGSACPNQYCIVDNPPRQELPIPAGVIQDWKDEAAAGGICGSPDCVAGSFTITNGASKSLGPKKITGSMTVDNNAILTLTGTVWVQGNILLSNGCRIRLAPGYGSNSGVIITDGTITVSNNCSIEGSGSPGSYIMLLSAKNAPAEDVIEVSNNTQGVIYYASNGRIEFANNSSAKEATGYGIDLSNNAVITYDSGLADVHFSAGPSGGYDIQYWKEVE